MAHRHLMAVCVVCLLCAEHLPCKEHVSLPSKNINDIASSHQRISPTSLDLASHKQTADIPASYLYDKRKDKTKIRQKRHADHHHHEASEHHHHTETPEVTKEYIQKLFATFSNNNTMNVDDFEKMMLQLRLTNLVSSKVQTENSSKCMSGTKFLGKMTETKDEEGHHDDHGHNHDDHSHDHHDDHDHHHPTTEHSLRDRIKIDSDHMLAICPILLYHVVNPTGNGCLDETYFNSSELFVKATVEAEPKDLVWLYSTLAIIVVSLCGLFGVAVIPIMEKHFYHHVLQFLVALAVGTLAGDALLHLLPHAMMPTSEDEDLHQTMMLRGLAAVGGIVFFYFFERFLTMITEWRQRRQKQVKPSSRTRVQRDPESVSLDNTMATCKHKYSDYPYCYGELAKTTHDDHHEHQQESSLLNHVDNKIKPHEDRIIVSPVEVKKVNGTINDNHIEPDNNTLSTSLDEGSIESNVLCNNNKQAAVLEKQKKDSVEEEDYKIILREHQRTHHGHSHTHGHVHSPPRSLSAVVWMVILGDGLHNFTDGMAIGAAFSNNIAGGFSTAFAVFCHELPHELGDFAVLLKAGMSAKQAVYYNILSSVLSFFGMCFGIWIGDTPSASQWIFAVAAGLFIYIALVDMMPELTSSHGKEQSCMLTQCLLQFLGMTCGFSTMLLIAIYEHDLKEIFDS